MHGFRVPMGEPCLPLPSLPQGKAGAAQGHSFGLLLVCAPACILGASLLVLCCYVYTSML